VGEKDGVWVVGTAVGSQVGEKDGEWVVGTAEG